VEPLGVGGAERVCWFIEHGEVDISGCEEEDLTIQHVLGRYAMEQSPCLTYCISSPNGNSRSFSSVLVNNGIRSS
jgi:hypothetical protein